MEKMLGRMLKRQHLENYTICFNKVHVFNNTQQRNNTVLRTSNTHHVSKVTSATCLLRQFVWCTLHNVVKHASARNVMSAQTNLGASLAACLAFSSATRLAPCLASCSATRLAHVIPLALPDTVENQPVSRTCSRRTGLLDFTHYIRRRGRRRQEEYEHEEMEKDHILV
jgi:hypothetical protein